MGKSMNLNNLTPEEAEQILKVIQKDFELRQKEKERLSKIEEDINEEENKTELLTKQQKFNENCCIRCCQTFGLIFNRKQTCQACKLFVCKSCSKYDDSLKGYTCNACLKEVELKHKSLDWFYNNVSKKYKRFGSAKIVRTLYKHSDGSRSHKFHWSDGDEAIIEEPEDFVDDHDHNDDDHDDDDDDLGAQQQQQQQADNESDSGYDPSLYSSFGQSESSVRTPKTRPSLQGLFPELTINEDSNKEIDNGLFSPPPLVTPVSPTATTNLNNSTTGCHSVSVSTNGNGYVDGYNDASPDTSFDSTQMSTQTMPVAAPRMATTPTQTIEDTKNQEKRDIYQEAFENTKRTEEAKFKVRFDNLLADMQQSFENLSPRDGGPPSAYGSTSYGDLMSTYKGRIKDMLVSLSQRLELAIESFDATCANNPSLTSQKVRLMISKLVEDRLGESLDLTSDEAVSDLSSLSDDSGEQKSLEDQIAQAVIARVLEIHRNQNGIHLNLDEPHSDDKLDSSDSEVKTVVRSRNSSISDEPNVTDIVPKESKLTKSDNKHIRSDRTGKKHSDSDINANISRNRVTSGSRNYEGETDENNENVFDDNENDDDDRLGEDFTDSAPVPPKRTRKGKTTSTKTGQDASSSERDESSSSGNEKNDKKRRLSSGNNSELDREEEVLLKQEFEKLRSFAREVVPRPLYEEAKFEEEIEPEPIDESMEYVTVDHEESQDEFSSRFFTYDKVHDESNRHLPDFGDLDYEYHDIGFNEIDPDLLSMNLAPILEETEEEMAEEEVEEDDEEEADWRGNWMFKGATGINPYNSLTLSNKPSHDFGEGIVRVPQPNVKCLAPIIGDRDVDEMSSDLSENGADDDQDLSDEENSFYAKTSEEIARITRKTASSFHTATEGESDLESVTSRPHSSSFSDSGIHGNRLDQNSFDSRVSVKSAIKLSEELVPAESDDPKFEIPPISVTIAEGEPAKLSCRVAGTQPIDIFWYKVTGEDLEELENSENYEIIKDGCRQNLTMYNMAKQDAGQYMCMAINEKGQCCQYFILSTKKNTMELKAPEFLKSLSDVEVTEGQGVKFRCKVKGYPMPRVVWYKDGQILMNQLNYKLEKFGNRDYILAIETASMDEDAEYSALAKNIAGEARSSAQLIVEPKDKPESVPKPKSPKQASVKKDSEKEKNKDEFPDLSYLRLGRSRSSSSKPSQSSTLSSSKASSSLSTSMESDSTFDKKDENNLSNLSQKMTMTKESVTEVAEDMLSSSKELSEITKSIAAMDKILEDLECDVYSSTSATFSDLDPNSGLVTSLVGMETIEYANDFVVLKESAENIRKVTGSALDSLNNTDGVAMRQRGIGAMATSTPRSSDTERVFNPDSDTSHIHCDSDVVMETHCDSDVAMETTHDTSEDSHKSEISFNLNPMNIKMGSSAKNKHSQSQPKIGRRQLSTSFSNEDEKTANDKHEKESQNSTIQMDRQSSLESSQTTYSPTESADNTDHNTSTDSSERLRVNLGPKRENKDPYRRDYFITDTPMMSRKTPTSPCSPPTSPRVTSSPRMPPMSPTWDIRPTSPVEVKNEQQRAHTEEKIYLAAGAVHHLGNKVQTLEEKMRAVNALQEQDKLHKLEGQVADTAAQIVTSEKQVKDIERSLSKLVQPQKEAPHKAPASAKTRQAPQAPPPRPITPPPVEKPEPTVMKGFTSEQDLPESRTEFNEDYGSLELPSVNRLKAMFGGSQAAEKDSSIKRGNDDIRTEPIHSITARSVSKKQLEKLKETTDDNPAFRVAIPTAGPINPGRATSLKTGGQQIKVTPNMPKQVYQSSEVHAPSTKTHIPKQSIQIASNVKKSDSDSDSSSKSRNVVKLNLAAGNTNRPISPEVTEHAQTFQPIKSTVTNNSQATSQSNDPIQTAITGNQIDTPEERKSPKIKSGAISAMSKFWERLNEGVEDEAPEILENQ